LHPGAHPVLSLLQLLAGQLSAASCC